MSFKALPVKIQWWKNRQGGPQCAPLPPWADRVNTFFPDCLKVIQYLAFAIIEVSYNNFVGYSKRAKLPFFL